MLKNWKNKKTYMVATGIVLITTLSTVTSQAGFVDPGSEEDPIVTKTYVDKKINELKQSVDTNLDKITKDIESIRINNDKNNNSNTQTISEKFEVLELKKGEVIIAEESAEIIVRSGVVHAIGSINGGLSDITEGIDLQTGTKIETNHLLIIPRGDGRGIEVKSNDTFVMIKGRYQIKK